MLKAIGLLLGLLVISNQFCTVTPTLFLKYKFRSKSQLICVYVCVCVCMLMINLDSILKNRDIILPTKVHLIRATFFPVVINGCESWTIKKTECWKIDVFELWCWRRLLRVPWHSRRPNQSILNEISLVCSLEGLMLKLQYFGHLMQIADSLGKPLRLGKIDSKRRRG